MLNYLKKINNNKIKIAIGSGLNELNIKNIIKKINIKEIHGTLL